MPQAEPLNHNSRRARGSTTPTSASVGRNELPRPRRTAAHRNYLYFLVALRYFERALTDRSARTKFLLVLFRRGFGHVSLSPTMSQSGFDTPKLPPRRARTGVDGPRALLRGVRARGERAHRRARAVRDAARATGLQRRGRRAVAAAVPRTRCWPTRSTGSSTTRRRSKTSRAPSSGSSRRAKSWSFVKTAAIEPRET